MERTVWLILVVSWLAIGTSSQAQRPSIVQDPALDNLVHPPGYAPATPATLGAVTRTGSGSRSMILIPGLGFSGAVFDDFMARHSRAFTMYAVTLPGFGATPALAMPPADSASYRHASWTRSSETAIVALMDSLQIRRTTIVAHWILASQIALRLALRHPDRVDGVVLLAGVVKAYYDNDTTMLHWSLDRRSRYADAMGSQWFRTVTRQTWDDNNFMSYDYALSPRLGLFLWREAASPSLPVWVRYLLEFYALDVTPDLANLQVPVLVVQPGFDDPQFHVEPGRNYMRNLTHDSWRDVHRSPGRVEFVTIPGARLFVTHDKPDELDKAIAPFLSRIR